MNAPRSELSLPGIDGGNPLGFLAALGTLRAVSLARPDWQAKLAWRPLAHWTPVLSLATEVASASTLLDALEAYLPDTPLSRVLALADDIKFTPDAFRNHLLSAIAGDSAADRIDIEMLTALGSEALSTDGGLVPDTALRTMSGAGHQHFLLFMRQLIENTTREHLDKALFQTWRHDDPQPSLRWDPSDDRRYALRWKNPSSDPILTVRGANRLAIEALPLFTTTVVGDDLKTPGFKGRGMNDTYWTWPMWEPFINLDVSRALLNVGLLQAEIDPAAHQQLSGMGIRQVFRAQRITTGKYRNFSSAQAIA
ncbi:MAG: hypothetical protein H6948_02955 [Zoogloeaceae bacterium]|nr:hypothetical protein [Zoogloeaceae bacterium]